MYFINPFILEILAMKHRQNPYIIWCTKIQIVRSQNTYTVYTLDIVAKWLDMKSDGSIHYMKLDIYHA